MSAFRVAMLASGSKGNAALISSGGRNFLVDIGISCRMLDNRLKEIGLTAQELDGVFITHEHTDHVKGLATFTKKYSVPVYSSERTWQAILRKDDKVQRKSCRVIGSSLDCGGVQVRSFATSHDAADPHGYSFDCAGSKCTYVTDTGFVTDIVREEAAGADTLILEANHDIKMLQSGSYPELLKRRILSTRGHLSNESAGWLLAKLPQLPENVILAHLSEENNLPQLAVDTVQNIFSSCHRSLDTRLLVASQDKIVTDF